MEIADFNVHALAVSIQVEICRELKLYPTLSQVNSMVHTIESELQRFRVQSVKA